jgi:integrase/recombinase XerD
MVISASRKVEIINLLIATWYKMTYPLFTNSQHNRLTKEGVAYVLGKYAVQAHKISDVVPVKVKCHMLSHSKAVHLLQEGVNLI